MDLEVVDANAPARVALSKVGMSDVFSKKERSRIMARIKSKNTGFEVSFLKILSAKIYPLGFRYRKHYKTVIGKPDIAFVRQKIAVFLDSDFWHGRNFARLKPRLKKGYWLNKITRNKKRDRKVTSALRRAGWKVLRFSESEIKKDAPCAVRRIEAGLRG